MKEKTPPLYKCTVCDGNRTIKGIFHNMICNQCSGLGYVGGDGKAVPADMVIMRLLDRLKQEKQLNMVLKEEMASLRRQVNHNPVYPAGSRHE